MLPLLRFFQILRMIYRKNRPREAKIACGIVESPAKQLTMPRLRISVVQYLNTAPLVYGFMHGRLRGKYDLSFTVPSECAEALRGGAVDIAIIPSIEYERIDGLVILPDIAIAAKNEVRSLLLIAKKPIEQVQRIALDRSSRSTQALVRILCAEHWEISPQFFEAPPDLGKMLQAADAALLIGDPALRLSIQIEGSAVEQLDGSVGCMAAEAEVGLGDGAKLFVYDVVQHWRRMTGWPAVLAVWAGRREIVTPEVVSDFLASRDLGVEHLGDICRAAEKELGIPAPALEDYLRNKVDFSLDRENVTGLIHYYGLCKKLNLIPQFKGIEIAASPGTPVRYHDVIWAGKRGDS